MGKSSTSMAIFNSVCDASDACAVTSARIAEVKIYTSVDPDEVSHRRWQLNHEKPSLVDHGEIFL